MNDVIERQRADPPAICTTWDVAKGIESGELG